MDTDPDQLKAVSWKIEARRLLEVIVQNVTLEVDELLLAWAKLKSWGNGQELASCRAGDLRQRERTIVMMYNCFSPEQIPEAKNELIVASQQQCAYELNISLSRLRSATARLVKRGLLTTPEVWSRCFVTRYKSGVGYRSRLATKYIQAFRPVWQEPSVTE